MKKYIKKFLNCGGIFLDVDADSDMLYESLYIYLSKRCKVHNYTQLFVKTDRKF